MMWLSYVSYFFGGVALGNAIPHFVSGMMGRAFQSPFANPTDKGPSSALVNVGWGAVNIPDEMTDTAVIDRLVHHGSVFAFIGQSHRLRTRGKSAKNP